MDDGALNDFPHRCFLACQCRKQQTTADGFAEDGQIRDEAERLLCAAGSDAKAGDRFIGNHEHAFAVAKFADRLDHAGHWLHAAGVAHDWFKNDRRDLTFELSDLAPQVLGIVPAGYDESIEHLRDHALARMQASRTFRVTPLVRRRCETHEPLIRPAMIGSLKFQNKRPPGVSTREPQRREHDFRGRVVKAHALGPRHHGLYPFGHLELQFALRRPMRAEFRLLGDGLRHARWCMPVEQRALADLEVDVFIAIHIPYA